MSFEAAQKELLRITEELEKRICSEAPRPRPAKCVQLIDNAVIAMEDVANACPSPNISSLVHDQIVWLLVWMKRVYGWTGK